VRIARRQWFLMDLIVWAAISVFLFVIWLLAGGGFPWFIIAVGAWGIVVDAHAAFAFALQSPEAEDLLMRMDPERKMESWHLVTTDGRTYSGGGAVSHLAGLLPAGAPIALLVSTFPRTTDRSYRWVARHRGRLGRAAPRPVAGRAHRCDAP